MADELTPKEILDKSLTHSTELKDLRLDLTQEPLECGFPSIEFHDYLVKNKGRIIAIAGRPGHGKSALAGQIAFNVAKQSRCLLFSLEMDQEALNERFLAIESGIPIKKLGLKIHEDRLRQARKDVGNYRLSIVDDSSLTIDALIRKILDETQRDKIDLVVIDYLGLVDLGEAHKDRAILMGKALNRLKKEVAERLKIPIIVVVQATRGFEDRYAKAKMEYEKAKQYPTGANEEILNIRPSMQELADSSWIEREVHVVMFVYRPCLLNPCVPAKLFKVFVVKNRSGIVQDFVLEFSQELTRFIDPGVL